jgi:hypothetical protein
MRPASPAIAKDARPDREGAAGTTRNRALRHITTVNLSAGTIDHVVNDTGAPVDNSNTGQPSFITEFPATI